MKDRIRIPPGLKARLDALVRAQAKALGTSEEDARRVVEQAIVQQGIAVLERRAEEGA